MPFADGLEASFGVPGSGSLKGLFVDVNMCYVSNTKWKEADNLKSFGELSREQMQRESSFLSRLMGETKVEVLADFEADLTQRQSRVLFEITTQIEDTEDALKQAEQLVQRLKKYLEQLKSLQRVLSKQR